MKLTTNDTSDKPNPPDVSDTTHSVSSGMLVATFTIIILMIESFIHIPHNVNVPIPVLALVLVGLMMIHHIIMTALIKIQKKKGK